MKGSIRLRYIPLLFVVLWGVASLSGVEVEPDLRRIDPAVLLRDNPPAMATPLGTPGRQGVQGLPLSVFIRLAADDDALPGQVQNLGGTSRKLLPRIYAARLPADTTRYLSNRSTVLYIEADRIARPLLDVSGPALSADLVQRGSPPLPRPFLGDGTIVGIVDTGLDGDHPDFAGRIEHTFSIPGLNPLQDTNGHGTHVTGIAAGDGSASSGTYTGMAPGAQLYIGRAGADFFTQSAIVEAIDDFLVAAQAIPISINLSLGVIPGPHDGTSSFETLINSRAADSGGSRRMIAVAAGNERDTSEHFRATVSPFEVVIPSVDFATGTTLATVEIWADGDDGYSVTATMGTDTATVPSGTSGSSSSGRISISNKVSNPPNGDTLISVTFRPPAGTTAASIRLARTRNGGTGNVDGYIDRFEGTFQGASSTGTVTEPANAENVLSIGSFNTKTGGGAGPVGDDSTFSSLGPTRDGRTKPDIMAPGSLIYSTRSGQATYRQIEIVDDNDNYAIMQGTSMATAHVTGIASLVWESNPSLTGARMRERLKRTADPPPDGSAAPNNTWGYGKINAFRAVTEPVASITAPATATPGNPVALSSGNSSGAFGNPLSYAWEFTSRPAGSTASLSSPAAASTSFTPDLPGEYVVSLTASQTQPPDTPPATAEAEVRVNNVPAASIAGPASDNVGLPVTFIGSGSSARDSGQTLTYRWVLVSRPAGSSASLPASNIPDVMFTPDVGGTYEIGLRVNDGLDDSVLATQSYTALGDSVSGSDGGGGAGCVIGIRTGEDDGASSFADLLLLLLPVFVLSARKPGCLSRHDRCPAASKRD